MKEGKKMAGKIKCVCGITFTVEQGQTHCNYCGIKLSDIGKEKINYKRESKKTIKAIKNETPKKFLTILLALTILFSAFLYVRAENIEKNLRNKDFKSNLQPAPTVLQPTPTPTTKPKVYVNPDPITDCVSSHPNCNGETIRLKKSQCSTIYCCGFSDGRWILYSSKEKCEAEAGKIVQQAPVQQVQKPITQTNQLNYYCYDNTLKYSYYTSSGEQCNKNNATSACKSLTKASIYDPCMKKCLDTANENSRICIWGYFGTNAAIENNPSLYQECTDENNKEHQQCMDTCSSPYQEALKKCY
jgi:hypothetical protein